RRSLRRPAAKRKENNMKARPASKILGPIRKPKGRRFIAGLACLGMLVLMTMMVRPPFSRAQTSEGIATYGSDCMTPKTRFNLGDTVCAVATDSLLPSAIDGTPSQRLFQWVSPDGNIFRVGPESTSDPQNVHLVVTVATNSTFVSETQLSGPAATCTNPHAGATGNSTCTIASLPANVTAQFTFIFQVDAGAPPGSGVTSTATVSSDTAEVFSPDNTFTASATIPETPTPTCDVTSPSDLATQKTPG